VPVTLGVSCTENSVGPAANGSMKMRVKRRILGQIPPWARTFKVVEMSPLSFRIVSAALPFSGSCFRWRAERCRLVNCTASSVDASNYNDLAGHALVSELFFVARFANGPK